MKKYSPCCCALLSAFLFLSISCSSAGPEALPAFEELQIPKDRQFTILAINDVYRIDGLASSGAGGLDRVQAIRSAVERDHENVLFLHAGDMIYPSFMSRIFEGRQMVDLLNLMDGDDRAFDERMFAVFGNHEFDQSGDDDIFQFQEHVHESAFTWLAANIDWKETMGTKVSGDNIVPHAIVDFDGLKVGLFGLSLAVDGVAYADFRASPEQLTRYAGELSDKLRKMGADYVVGLTHLAAREDELLIKLEGGPDLIIGGHEHDALSIEHDNKYVFKADADAVTANLITVTLPADGASPVIDQRLLRIQHVEDPGQYENIDPNPVLTDRINWWGDRTSMTFCSEIDLSIDCLQDILARAGTTLIAEELSIRSEETNVGNFVTDLMAQAGRDFGNLPADATVVAFTNSGSLRLNQNILDGAIVNRQHVEELIQYDGPLYLLKLSADELSEALGHASECRGSGAWLQVSGISYTANPSEGTASDVRLHGSSPDENPIYAVTVQYIADPDYFGDQDGYTFTRDNIVEVLQDNDGNDIMLKELIYNGIEALDVEDGFRDLSPSVEGRIRFAGPDVASPDC